MTVTTVPRYGFRAIFTIFTRNKLFTHTHKHTRMHAHLLFVGIYLLNKLQNNRILIINLIKKQITNKNIFIPLLVKTNIKLT